MFWILYKMATTANKTNEIDNNLVPSFYITSSWACQSQSKSEPDCFSDIILLEYSPNHRNDPVVQTNRLHLHRWFVGATEWVPRLLLTSFQRKKKTKHFWRPKGLSNNLITFSSEYQQIDVTAGANRLVLRSPGHIWIKSHHLNKFRRRSCKMPV